MPYDCTDDLTNITYDCLNVGTAGIEQNAVIINKDDIDYEATTLDAENPLLVTDIVLKPGKTGIRLEGIKQSNGKAYELVKKENAPDKFKHTFSGVIFSPSLQNKLNAQKLATGGRYVVVIEQTWKGADSKDAFEVLGLNSGLESATMTNNSKENDNMIVFELSSVDGYEEPTVPKTFLDGGLPSGTYTLSKTAFDNLFAQAETP